MVISVRNTISIISQLKSDSSSITSVTLYWNRVGKKKEIEGTEKTGKRKTKFLAAYSYEKQGKLYSHQLMAFKITSPLKERNHQEAYAK